VVVTPSVSRTSSAASLPSLSRTSSSETVVAVDSSSVSAIAEEAIINALSKPTFVKKLVDMVESYRAPNISTKEEKATFTEPSEHRDRRRPRHFEDEPPSRPICIVTPAQPLFAMPPAPMPPLPMVAYRSPRPRAHYGGYPPQYLLGVPPNPYYYEFDDADF